MYEYIESAQAKLKSICQTCSLLRLVMFSKSTQRNVSFPESRPLNRARQPRTNLIAS